MIIIAKNVSNMMRNLVYTQKVLDEVVFSFNLKCDPKVV